MMRVAMWHGGHDLRLEEQEVPTPGPGDVLVEVVACGVCGTDVHTLEDHFPLYKPPKPLGHETAGLVRALGAGVESLRPGDAVALDTSVPCGACFYCREGQSFLCLARVSYTGGFADFQLVPAAVAYRLPPGIPVELGIFAEPLSCCLHALDRSGLRAGDRAAIVGGGAVGQILASLVRGAGASLLVVSDPEPARRTTAIARGADRAVDPAVEALEAVVKGLTGGLGVDVAFEVVGRPETVAACLRLPRRGGTVMLVGVSPPTAELTVHPYEIYERELTIRGSFIRSNTFQRAVSLLGRLDLPPLISHRFPLLAVDTAIANVRERRGLKTIVHP
ncbi:MAG: zinc-dependent alcohol dehydrogenase family protein [Chloroflexota bacterium]